MARIFCAVSRFVYFLSFSEALRSHYRFHRATRYKVLLLDSFFAVFPHIRPSSQHETLKTRGFSLEPEIDEKHIQRFYASGMEGGGRNCSSCLAGNVGFPRLSLSMTGDNIYSSLTENEHARRKNINEVICISKDPQADLQSEGFRNAPDLEAVTFTIDSDTEGDMLWIFGEVYDIIDKILAEMKGVLMWDTGGGVAMMAAYGKYDIMCSLTSYNDDILLTAPSSKQS